MVVYEDAVKIDDCDLGAGVCGEESFQMVGGNGEGGLEGGFAGGQGEEEEVVDGLAAGQGVGRAGLGVLVYQVFQEEPGVEGGFLGKGELPLGGSDGAIGVVGEGEGDGLGGGWAGGGEGGFVFVAGEALVSLGAAAQKKEEHDQATSGESPEEDALVAGDHGWAPEAGLAGASEGAAGGGLGGATWAFHATTDWARESAMRC